MRTAARAFRAILIVCGAGVASVASAQTATVRWLEEPQNLPCDGSPGWLSPDGCVVFGAWTGYSGDGDFARWTEADGYEWLLPGYWVFGPRVGDVTPDGRVMVADTVDDTLVWRAETGLFEAIHYSPRPVGLPVGVSDDGNTVVFTVVAYSNVLRAAYWTAAGGIVEIPNPFGDDHFSAVAAISSDGGTIVGALGAPGSVQAFRAVNGAAEVLGPLPAGKASADTCWVSQDGAIVLGKTGSANGVSDIEPYRWTPETGMTLLGHFPDAEANTYLRRASPDARVAVGSYSFEGAASVAIVWSEANGYLRVSDILSSAGVNIGADEFWTCTGVSDDARTIIGTGKHNGHRSGWLIRWAGDTCGPPHIGGIARFFDMRVGKPLRLAISLSGSPPFSCQWRHNGVEIPGATGEVYLIPHATLEDAGVYDCAVTNDCGTATSEPTSVCLADRDQNGFVNGDDFDVFIESFIEYRPLVADVNGDGWISGEDFDLFVSAFEAGC